MASSIEAVRNYTTILKGVLDDFSLANPNRSNRVLERFARIVEVPQVRFYTGITLQSGDSDQFGYVKAAGGYERTKDTEVDSSKTYYTDKDRTFTAVTSPTKAGLKSYYGVDGTGKDINFMVVEKSAAIKFDKHVSSRVFQPDELESLDSYMMKHRKYGIFLDSFSAYDVCVLRGWEPYLAVTAVPDIEYLLAARSILPKAQVSRAMDALFEMFSVADAQECDCILAKEAGLPDFEDGIIAYSAKRNGIDAIVTRNLKHFAKSPIAAICPRDFVRMYKPAEVTYSEADFKLA